MKLYATPSKSVSKSFLALLLLLWARYPIWEYMSGALSYMPGLGSLGQISIAIIIGVLSIISWQELIKYIKIRDVLFYFVILFIYFLSYYLHPENQTFLDEKYTQPFLLTVSPYFFVGLLVNMDRDKQYFLYISYLSVFFQFIYIFLLNKGGVRGNEADNMIGYAYNLLPHVTFISYWLIEKKTVSSVLFFLAGFLLLISMANRGSIVCLMTFMLIYLLVFRFYKQKLLIKILMMIGVVLFVAFFQQITILLYILMNRLSLNTRVLDFVLSSSFTQSEGRNEITETILRSFKDNIFVMHGIGGENQLGVIYAHNILIEWWYAFGIIIGSLMMVFLLYLIIKAFLKSSGVSKAFLLLLITSGFECLFLSGTYLMSSLFFLLIGFSINCIRRSNIVKRCHKKIIFRKKEVSSPSR